MNFNVIINEIHRLSLSKILVIGGFIVLLTKINDTVGYLMIVFGLYLYFRKR